MSYHHKPNQLSYLHLLIPAKFSPRLSNRRISEFLELVEVQLPKEETNSSYRIFNSEGTVKKDFCSPCDFRNLSVVHNIR